MKKLIFVLVFALLGTYFQSAQAQTFSRVVTVNRSLNSAQATQRNGQIDTLFTVPSGKIFKIEYLQGSNFYDSWTNVIVPIFINGILITSVESRGLIDKYGKSSCKISSTLVNTSVWLKSGDVISCKIEPSIGEFQVFLSGIEYDAQ